MGLSETGGREAAGHSDRAFHGAGPRGEQERGEHGRSQPSADVSGGKPRGAVRHLYRSLLAVGVSPRSLGRAATENVAELRHVRDDVVRDPVALVMPDAGR